ncbi:hypothetical protein BH23ACT11_BH23ACT11_12300 [soil metagenome]
MTMDPRSTSLTIQSQTRHLEKVRRFVGSRAEAAGLSEVDVRAVELAVDEACANTIKHAYGGREDGVVEIETEVLHHCDGSGVFAVTVRHQGDPFDPQAYEMPSLRKTVSEKRRGGYGLHLIHRLVDQVQFAQHGATSEVILSKRIS